MSNIINKVEISFENGVKSTNNENRNIPQIRDFYKIGMRMGYFLGNEFKTSIISALTITSIHNKYGKKKW